VRWGLVLSAVGLYGVMAYMVEQRTREIGVRMALGADRGRVLRMVLRGAFSQVAIGLAIGIPAAVRAGKLMTQQLRSVRPWDPVMLASATLALGLAALLTSALPAWRAAGVGPWWRCATNEQWMTLDLQSGPFLNPSSKVPQPVRPQTSPARDGRIQSPARECRESKP
jgi:hypothetical protein